MLAFSMNLLPQRSAEHGNINLLRALAPDHLRDMVPLATLEGVVELFDRIDSDIAPAILYY